MKHVRAKRNFAAPGMCTHAWSLTRYRRAIATSATRAEQIGTRTKMVRMSSSFQRMDPSKSPRLMSRECQKVLPSRISIGNAARKAAACIGRGSTATSPASRSAVIDYRPRRILIQIENTCIEAFHGIGGEEGNLLAYSDLPLLESYAGDHASPNDTSLPG